MHNKSYKALKNMVPLALAFFCDVVSGKNTCHASSVEKF
jgi:hypothetical protein